MAKKKKKIVKPIDNQEVEATLRDTKPALPMTQPNTLGVTMPPKFN